MRAPNPLRIVFSCLVLAAAAAPAAAQGVCDGISQVDIDLTGEGDLTKVLIADNVPDRPLFVTSPPGDTTRRFIVGQDGVIWLHKRGDGALTLTQVLDISTKLTSSGNEQGLLGLAFDPDFDGVNNRFFYVNYTEPGPLFQPNSTLIARYEMSDVNPDVAIDNEVAIMRFSQPQSNHNGGWIGFGPDNYLYIATGDGGGANDQFGTCGNGQNTDTLLGKMLRIDVKGIAPMPASPDCDTDVGNYDVPSDNPFATSGGCREIWAYGLRNPWRAAFDRANGDQYIADVGQGCWEELNYVPAGVSESNYGWRQMEGDECFEAGGSCTPSNQPCVGSPDCNDPSLVLPVLDYPNSSGQPMIGEGCSVTGGYVYRGCRVGNLSGTYFWGDYCSGIVRSFRIVGGAATEQIDWTSTLGVGVNNNLPSFGEDGQGEIYVVERTGDIRKIVPILPLLEVSGPGAEFFQPSRDADWTWEDLEFTSEHPLVGYEVYRGVPNGTFTCIHQTTGTSWTGDPDTPMPGELFAYIVTAQNAGGERTSTGTPERTLSPDACPGP